MNTWFTSDLHVGHSNIIEYSDRPYDDVPHMTEMLVQNWNAVVAPEDVVIVVGDFAMGKIAETLPVGLRLAGIKYLVPGNHDRVFSDSYASKKPEKQRANWGRWYTAYTDAGFAILPEQFTQTFHGHEVNVCHFPYSGDHTAEDRYADKRPVDDGKWLLCGHVHEAWQVRDRQINVGVDVWDYAPVNITTLIEIMEATECDDS